MNWWEPGTPGVLDIGDISIFLGALIAFTTVLTMVSRMWMRSLRKVINEEITVATEPIHPHANGGLSLADVARKTDSLEKQMNRIEAQSAETKDLLIKFIAESGKGPSVKSTTTTRKPRARKAS
jgi:hypothetical protein